MLNRTRIQAAITSFSLLILPSFAIAAQPRQVQSCAYNLVESLFRAEVYPTQVGKIAASPRYWGEDLQRIQELNLLHQLTLPTMRENFPQAYAHYSVGNHYALPIKTQVLLVFDRGNETLIQRIMESGSNSQELPVNDWLMPAILDRSLVITVFTQEHYNEMSENPLLNRGQRGIWFTTRTSLTSTIQEQVLQDRGMGIELVGLRRSSATGEITQFEFEITRMPYGMYFYRVPKGPILVGTRNEIKTRTSR